MTFLNTLWNWIKTHPRLSGWAALALGMNAIVAFEAQDVGLEPMQWVALIIATTVVAGLCVWIIGWDDDDDDAPADKTAPPPPAKKS